MRQPRLHSFLTGLHFALVQFCFLLLLVFNISSTYLSYALVVTAWMTGAIVGLSLRTLDLVRGLIIGILAYYAALAVVLHDPLAWTARWITGAAVFLTGLWAGRFFVAMLPQLRRPDSLFFHENNGFLVGVATSFVAFTLLGRPVLMWAPLVSSAVLIAHGHWKAK